MYQAKMMYRGLLQPSATFAATASIASIVSPRFKTFRQWIVTLDITAAERDSANETYDIYITTGDGVSSWDLVHFPQIATTGAKRYTAFANQELLPQNVSTAGTAANDPGLFKTDTGGSNEGIKTLGAGRVRHGAFGDRIGAEVVIAGTVATGITFSITVEGVA
jgi:hypothetical protein